VTSQYLTIGQLAERFGIATWQARRAVDTVLPDLPRAGLYRLVPMNAIDRIESALRDRGYLREAQPCQAR
jgi:hypothetical protein